MKQESWCAIPRCSCGGDPKVKDAALPMLDALLAVQSLVNSTDFHDETKRLEIWSQVDTAIKLAKGK
jgi:hypothetical protein